MYLKKRFLLVAMLLFFVVAFSACENYADSPSTIRMEQSEVTYILPAPRTAGEMSVEQALSERRSRRNFQDTAISAEQLSQILWAAYGITQPRPDAQRGGLRTTPSAGAIFPLQIYVVIGNVEGIEPGVYRYISEEHKIVQIVAGDVRNALADAALGQNSVRNAPAIVAYSADFAVMLPRYGERGIMYTYIEVGHSAQNVYLQAEALGLGTVAVGALVDDDVAEVLNLPENETPLYLMPFGYFN
jgi:SagB-type dehydrogenase family enzyme